ncbi:hypothetical protein PP707_03355, partial [Acetobacter pasteurianus]|nr:hypothetical protein [Acetobacter pasteurianus]
RQTDRETVVENNIYRLMHVSSDSLTIYQVGIVKLGSIQNKTKQSKKIFTGKQSRSEFLGMI